MKFIELKCPYCGGRLDLHDDRKFAECLYCGHKVMIQEDKAVEVNLASNKVDPEFEKLRYAIINDDKDLEDYKFESDGACAWFSKGYQQLDNLCCFDGDNFKQCEAAWRMSFSKMDTDYLLTDYARLIGICLGKIDEFKRDYDSNPGFTHRLLETICEYICERFNIQFTSDFYYAVFTGFSKSTNLDETGFEILFYLISNSLKYETTPDAFVTKCLQFEKVTHRFNNESLEHDCKATISAIGYAVQQKLKKNMITRDTYTPKWTESALITRFGQDWDVIEKMWSDIHEHYTIYDLDGLRNDILQSVITGRPYDSGNEESVEEYEHIEENTQTIAQKMKKERCFTQFFILNGNYYTRSIAVKAKEFTGDVHNPNDLETLKNYFEEAYKNYVPFGADPSDYYDEFEGTVDVNFDLTEYYSAIADFVNGYLGGMPSTTM